MKQETVKQETVKQETVKQETVKQETVKQETVVFRTGERIKDKANGSGEICRTLASSWRACGRLREEFHAAARADAMSRHA